MNDVETLKAGTLCAVIGEDTRPYSVRVGDVVWVDRHQVDERRYIVTRVDTKVRAWADRVNLQPITPEVARVVYGVEVKPCA